MSFKPKNNEKALWKDWLSEHKNALEKCNLPEIVLKSRNHWEDFLLHGFLDHHSETSNFSIDDLSQESQKNLLNFLQNELETEEKESYIVFKLLKT